jgi:AraC-like DNA-binding protein
MTGGAPSDVIRFSVARDVGKIELLHAWFNRRGMPPHWHDEYSVSVSLRGGVAFDFRGSKHSAPSGVISCIAPGEVHNAYSADGGDWEFVSLLIPTQAVRELLSGLECKDDPPDLPRRLVSDPEMARRLIWLHARLQGAGDLLERQSSSLVILADFFRLHSSLRCQVKSAPAGHGRVQRARDYLHQRYAEPISLAGLAEHAGLSPFYFLRTFRTAVGMSPHAYLTQIRVIEAKRQLAGGATAAEAALACGFCDQSHLTRHFKRTTFVTPGEYQRRTTAFHHP